MSTFPPPDRPRRLAHCRVATLYKESTCLLLCVGYDKLKKVSSVINGLLYAVYKLYQGYIRECATHTVVAKTGFDITTVLVVGRL